MCARAKVKEETRLVTWPIATGQCTKAMKREAIGVAGGEEEGAVPGPLRSQCADCPGGAQNQLCRASPSPPPCSSSNRCHECKYGSGLRTPSTVVHPLK